MGTLAGMSTRLSVRDGGAVQIADPGTRNLRSLEDLGLDHLMEIDPPEAVWRGNIQAIRGGLKSSSTAVAIDTLQRARHVLEAHQNLSELNDKNAQEFSGVVTTLKNSQSGEVDVSGAKPT